MDFAISVTARDYQDRLAAFMIEHVFPAEAHHDAYPRERGPADHTVVEELKILAMDRGLWNRFLQSDSGLTKLECAPLAELTGWSTDIAPEALNCAAPDTGNIESLHVFAN